MAQIIEMNELVPEDIIVRYGNPPVDYKIPGDIDVETVFRLFEMFQALSSTEGNDQEVFDSLKAKFGDIRAELLKLFQVRDPKLKELPFGLRGTGALLRVILGQLGLVVTAENPTPPKRKTTPKRTVPRARR